MTFWRLRRARAGRCSVNTAITRVLQQILAGLNLVFTVQCQSTDHSSQAIGKSLQRHETGSTVSRSLTMSACRSMSAARLASYLRRNVGTMPAGYSDGIRWPCHFWQTEHQRGSPRQILARTPSASRIAQRIFCMRLPRQALHAYPQSRQITVAFDFPRPHCRPLFFWSWMSLVGRKTK